MEAKNTFHIANVIYLIRTKNEQKWNIKRKQYLDSVENSVHNDLQQRMFLCSSKWDGNGTRNDNQFVHTNDAHFLGLLSLYKS